MPMAREKGGDFVPAPEGTHIARCVDVISLGIQTSELFAPSFKVMIGWELPDEVMIRSDTKQEMPLKVSKEFTLSLSSKANLRKILESWRGKAFTKEELEGFEVSNVLGVPCLLTVIHKNSTQGKTYAAIEAVSKLGKGMACKPQVHPSIRYEIEQGRDKVFKELPEWIQKKIENCQQWLHPEIDREEPEPEVPLNPPPEEDDVPFSHVDAIPR
jgi:hypothetical protein